MGDPLGDLGMVSCVSLLNYVLDILNGVPLRSSPPWFLLLLSLPPWNFLWARVMLPISLLQIKCLACPLLHQISGRLNLGMMLPIRSVERLCKFLMRFLQTWGLINEIFLWLESSSCSGLRLTSCVVGLQIIGALKAVSRSAWRLIACFWIKRTFFLC